METNVAIFFSMEFSRGKLLVNMVLNNQAKENQSEASNERIDNQLLTSSENVTHEHRVNESTDYLREEDIIIISPEDENLVKDSIVDNVIIEESFCDDFPGGSAKVEDSYSGSDYCVSSSESEDESSQDDVRSSSEPEDGSSQDDNQKRKENETVDKRQEFVEEAEYINQSDDKENKPTENEIRENVDAGDENEDTPPKKKARVTRKKRFESKAFRMRGKAYKGLKKDDDGKYHLTSERKARELGPTCTAESCKKSNSFFCNTFSNEERQMLFKKFWGMLTWDMRKTYVGGLVDYIPSKRRKEDSRRKGTLVYHLKKGTERKRVCKKMFLSTLGLGEWFVREYSQSMFGINESENDIRKEGRNRQTNPIKRNTLSAFLSDLPKLPSHYCRASTSSLYLEPTFQSKTDLYREYLNYCSAKHVDPVSLTILKEELKKQNLKIFRPRKDQCDLCISHKLGHVDDVKFQTHQRNKTEARLSKDLDKERCQNNPEEIAVFCVDVQAVKLSPMLKASAIYYKTKLSVHNYTTYNLYNGEVNCHLWDESQAGLEASVFATLLVDLLEERLVKQPSTKKIIIYSDGCCYQNKNCTLSNALLKFAMDKKITICQKYFEKGHSQMEVDSVHSAIENRLKNRDIYVPMDYIAVCKEARPKNPYNVKYKLFSDFRNYAKVKYYGSIRPGTKPGDPQVNDVRSFIYYPEGIVKYKLNHNGCETDLPRRTVIKDYSITSLYKSRQKIKEEKYSHLQQLKQVLDRQFWNYYDELPH